MKIVDLPLADLKPYENNPRDNDKAVDAVAASINEFGFKIPIIIDSDNIIPKPLALCARAIRSSSRTEEIVLDVFGGSGSTLIACEQLNRKCYMCELDEHYCDVIIQRWENLTGQTAELISE